MYKPQCISSYSKIVKAIEGISGYISETWTCIIWLSLITKARGNTHFFQKSANENWRADLLETWKFFKITLKRNKTASMNWQKQEAEDFMGQNQLFQILLSIVYTISWRAHVHLCFHSILSCMLNFQASTKKILFFFFSRLFEDKAEICFSLAIKCCLDKTSLALDPRVCFPLFISMHCILDPHKSGGFLLHSILPLFLFLDFPRMDFFSRHQRWQLFTQEQVSHWHLAILEVTVSEWKTSSVQCCQQKANCYTLLMLKKKKN